MASFLHCADLHLGMRLTRFAPDKAGTLRENRFTALDNILKLAAERKVDFLLIVGDLFDDLTADQLTAGRAFRMLAEGPVPVYVLPGNHDPLLAGGVWDRPPWSQPAARVRLLREPAPVEVGPGLLLFPCPCLRKTSRTDPTAWIEPPAGPGRSSDLRIGLAHGSLLVRDNLPPDDHPIARFAVHEKKLDYLALGHWHGRRLYPDPDGVERTAYPGVHEPMRFQGSVDCQTGWVPHSGAGREEFFDSGTGEVLHVRIRGPHDPPEITPLEVGHHIWQEERRELTCEEDLGRLIADVATRSLVERRLLRLQLTGFLDAATLLRLDELREILTRRYFFGELDAAGVHLRPTDAETRRLAGQGVLAGVLDRLQQEAGAPDAADRQVAERAILLLHHIAREVQP